MLVNIFYYKVPRETKNIHSELCAFLKMIYFVSSNHLDFYQLITEITFQFIDKRVSLMPVTKKIRRGRKATKADPLNP